MVKIVIFFKRKPGMSVEAFRRHWGDSHARLVEKLPGLRRYVQNHVLTETYAKGEPAFDGVAESSFDDTQAMKDLARTPFYAEVLADEPKFIDRASMGSIITEERVIKDGPAPAGGVKRIRFVARQAQVPVDEFFSRFLEHGARCAQAAQVRRYVQCHCRRAIYDSGRTPAFDGAAMSWYDDLKALNATREPELTVAARAPLMLVSERVVSIP